MALIDELKQKRAECDERYKRVLLDHAYYAGRLNDLDTAIAALESIPTPEEIGIALDEIEAAEAKLLDDEPEPSLFDAKDEPEPTSQQDNVVAYFISGDGPIEFRAYGPITQVVDEPEPTELDAPASIVDDPELQAAVSRAEATLAAAGGGAYVGLQDPELDADWDAMKERQEAGKKLHFSIFGKVGE